MNKALKVLTTAALLGSIVTAVPAYAANTKTFAEKAPSVATDFESKTASDAISYIDVKADDLALNPGDVFRLELPSGVKFQKDLYNADPTNIVTGATVTTVTDSVLELKVTATDVVRVPMLVKVDGATGSLTVNVNPLDSNVSGANLTFAYTSTGKTIAAVDDVKTIQDASSPIGNLRIDETSVGALYNSGNVQKVQVKLPNNYKFQAGAGFALKFGGGFASDSGIQVGSTAANISTANVSGDTATLDSSYLDDRTLTFYVKFSQPTTSRGSIYIGGLNVQPNDSATYGDVVATVSGDKVTTQDLTVATYANYSTAVSAVDSTVPTLFAGRMNNDDDLKLGKLDIKENIPGSFISGRKTRVQLPDWMKIVKVKVEKADHVNGDLQGNIDSNIDGTKNYVDFIVPDADAAGSKRDIQLTIYATSKVKSSGDVVATVSGPSTATGTATIGKVVAPISVSASNVSNLKIGKNAQAVGDVTITEAAAGAISGDKLSDGSKPTLDVILDSNSKWDDKPTVKVTQGDIDLDTANMSVDSTDSTILHIPVKSASTKPSTIVLSGATVDVDRTVAEGKFAVLVKGKAVTQNNKGASGYAGENDLSKAAGGTNVGSSTVVDAGEFDASTQGSADFANVVTPAPGETTSYNVVFKLNSKTYTVDGKEMTMDAGPFVKWDRAFLPLRFAANALNVADANILWDDNSNTATIMNGGRVITAKVGDYFLTVNGTKLPMPVPVYRSKAETANRVMIPIRYLSLALNADIQWNQQTGEITIGGTAQ